MKRLFLASFLLGATLLAARADSTFWSSGITIVTASTNTPVLQTNTAYVSLGTILVAHGTINITNSFSGTLQWSVDQTNFYNVGTNVFYPSGTNAATDTIRPQTVLVPVYFRLSATTNAANTAVITVSGTYLSP